MNFKKGQKVVKVIDVNGSKSATIQEVERVAKNVVHLVDSSLTYYAATGKEIDPAMAFANITSEIVPFDGGEAERWFGK